MYLSRQENDEFLQTYSIFISVLHLVHLPKAPNLFSRSSLTFLLKFCLVFIHSSLIFLATGMPKMNFYRHRIFKCSFRAALLLLKIQRGGKKGTFLSKLRRKIWEKSLNQFTLQTNSIPECQFYLLILNVALSLVKIKKT